MSSREPMWYCHQCNAEMRPLMVPDPVCASCHGDFVEKIEDPDDDPREFQHGDPMDDAGIDPFLMVLQGLMNRGMPEQRSRPSSPRHNRSPSGNSSSSFSFQIRSGSGGPAVFSIGGPNTLGGTRAGSEPSGRPSNLADFIQSGDERAPGIAGPLMAQYLMALLGNRGSHTDFLGGLGDAAERGRMGDYVFNQEALDQIISNLMENSNASRPVPATDEIMDKLPREILEAGSKTLEKDCAVCKEQFQLQTEDPDEQIVITLPCGHPFHSSCILPWLKSSGTCPVCRHQLIAQPEHHALPPSPPSGDGPSRSSGSGGEGIFQHLFGSMMGGGSGSTSNPNSARNVSGRSSNPTDGRSQRNRGGSSSNPGRQNSEDHHLPGGWDNELD
ncbi:uncharacterized protein C8R40DRAFT_1083458 [Lentinula edodes]|uniref:uncharacterized protein n=1 Tax=Lentinula edodes TaxID=5353 RepID=UPI001E8E9163|nr:uncharacterized protein C8R40DRAFT_1083458 [Lentinula edodes]KAH7879855.1 hypothetical protein C8R40DRAFT_1083458 [Lentinula edodes]